MGRGLTEVVGEDDPRINDPMPVMVGLLDDLLVAANDFDAAIDPDASLETLAQSLVGIRQLRRDLSMVESGLEHYILSAMPERKAPVSFGVLQKKRGSARKEWDNPMVVDAVMAEAHKRGQDGVETLLEAASMTWRVGVLRNLDIDPDEWCHVEWGADHVVITEGAVVDGST